MKKINKKFEIELNVMKYKVHAESPYNDGWTREMYRDMYENELKKLEKIKNVKDRSK